MNQHAVTELAAELDFMEERLKAILDGRFTKNEIHGRVLEVWGKVRAIKQALGR